MLTGKDVYEAARPNIVKHGFEDLEWEDFVPGAQEFYLELAARLNNAHITPLQGLVQELEGLVDWDNFTEAYEEDTLKRIKQLCGEESKS